MNNSRVVVIAGSIRTGSINKKLAKLASKELATLGVEVNFIDLANYPANIYNGDDEARSGLPQSMKSLKQIIKDSDAMVVVTPEYNGFISPLLVNVFSWVSRPENNEEACIAFKNKFVVVMSASPGKLGGIRAIPRLKDIMQELGCIVMPGFIAISHGFEAFDENNNLKNEKNINMLKGILSNLVRQISIK